ncbi:MAG: arginine repressor [Oscillospiraceae bacterium]|nr:arginine repressor [Oscillospiraceae bacterium]
MKSQRQAKILELIGQKDIETQEQLLLALEESGFRSTQATISRDIKELRIVKELSPAGAYRYTVQQNDAMNLFSRLNNIFRESVIKVDYAQNIVVIKTLPGLANGACSAVDSMDIAYVVGTIAGDDTALIVMRETEYAREFCEELRGIINRTR